MYSVVLMTAMMSNPVTPDGLFNKGGGGCCGQQTSCCQQQSSCDSCGGGRRSKKHRGGGGCGCCGTPCGGCCGSPCGGCAPVQACGCCGGAGGMMMPMGGTMGGTPAPAPAPAPAPKPGPGTGTMAPNAATIVVNGAKDAKVLIGGLVSAGSGDTRTMVSPALDAGQVYHYDLTAETVRDGQTVRLTRAVTIRAGETTEVQLDFAAGSVVMK